MKQQKLILPCWLPSLRFMSKQPGPGLGWPMSLRHEYKSICWGQRQKQRIAGSGVWVFVRTKRTRISQNHQLNIGFVVWWQTVLGPWGVDSQLRLLQGIFFQKPAPGWAQFLRNILSSSPSLWKFSVPSGLTPHTTPTLTTGYSCTLFFLETFISLVVGFCVAVTRQTIGFRNKPHSTLQ